MLRRPWRVLPSAPSLVASVASLASLQRPLAFVPWPLPAVLAWAACWAVWWAAGLAGVPPALGAGLATLAGAGLGMLGSTRWRRAIVSAGFPLSALALGVASALPAWVWLAMAVPLAGLYPLRAWRDAPLFPTPTRALHGLDAVIPRPAEVLDAGCGLGHGLSALRGLWPGAQLGGIEWSHPLAWACRIRCRALGLRASVRQGDMWRDSWRPYDVVYLFQRPESLARALAKAGAEMAPGSWLVSLEFAADGVAPHTCLSGPGRRPLWVYRVGAAAPRVADSPPCSVSTTVRERR